jgi:AmmeMemoRadiSam system protein B
LGTDFRKIAAESCSQPVGLLSPHIDYARGGAVYAHVWKRAAQVARQAELVILLGTDHYGLDLFTLTRQNFATPYGILPTDTALVDRLAAVIGEEAAYAGELRHRGEHSLELVAVWLHHMRAGQPVPIVPILTGSFHPFMVNGASPASDPTVAGVLAVLRAAMAGKRALVVASGDLAHVGPAFGGAPLDGAARRVLRQADEALIAAMRAGDAGQFFGAIRQVQNANNVCGVAPIYLTLRLLGRSQGAQAGYALCPADAQNTSVVSVTGMMFKAEPGA